MARFKSVLMFVVVLGFTGWAAPARAQLTITTGPTLNGAIGANTFTLSASGGTAPYHFSITPGFSAPAGFRVQDGQPLPINFPTTAGLLVVATTGTQTSGPLTTSIRVTDATAAFVDKVMTLNITPLQMSTN